MLINGTPGCVCNDWQPEKLAKKHSFAVITVVADGLAPLGAKIYTVLTKQVHCLTHWGRDKMAAIFQTTFWKAFSWMKMYEFGLIFYWSFVPKVRINNIPALVQIMAWCRSDDKQLSEPMMVSLLPHICVTRPQLTEPGWRIHIRADCRFVPSQWGTALLCNDVSHCNWLGASLWSPMYMCQLNGSSLI